MKVLVTGASGMVGRNLVELGKERNGYSFLTPDRETVDLLSKERVLDYLRAERPDIVVHCAGAVAGIQANIREPVKYLVENTIISFNVIEASWRAGVKRLINLGSSCMYPKHASNPLHEEDILTGSLEPTNEGYSLAKISAARLCDYICRQDPGVAFRTLIPCNLYGRYDKFDESKSHLVAAIIHKIHQAKRNGDDSVEIWGDGKAKREFMFCGDFAEFIYFALDKFEELPQLLNVGTGQDHTVNHYYKTVAKVLGYEGNFVHDLSQPVGMDRKVVSVKSLNSFGWQPRTSLVDGIKETYRFYLESVRRD